MIIFEIIVFMILSLFINKIFLKKMITLPSLVTIIWCTTSALSYLGLYNVFIPPKEVAIYLLIFVCTFNISSIFFNLYVHAKDTKTEYKINHNLLDLVLIICIIGEIIMCHKSLILLLKTHDFSTIRNSFISYQSINTYEQVFLTITFTPLGKACYIISAIDLIENKKIKKSFILSIIFSILCVLLNGGRSILFFMIATFGVGLYLKEYSILRMIKKNKKITRLCIILVILCIIISSQRNLTNGGVFTSIYVYFCGCFNLFGTYLDSGMVFKEDLLLGRELISGFSFPLVQILRYIFGFNILPGNYILAAEATSKYIAISPVIAINATPTTMFHAIRDFGLIGLFIYPTIISYFYIKLKKKYEQYPNILNSSYYVYYIFLCLLLNMNYQFETFQNVGVFIYISVLCMLFKTEKVDAEYKYN